MKNSHVAEETYDVALQPHPVDPTYACYWEELEMFESAKSVNLFQSMNVVRCCKLEIFLNTEVVVFNQNPNNVIIKFPDSR